MQGQDGEQRLLLARRDSNVPIVRITNFESTQKPNPHSDDGIGILAARSAVGKRPAHRDGMTTTPNDRAAGSPSPADPIAAALLTVEANVAGDATAAQQLLVAAQQQSQSAVRRQRQVLEIARLVVDGATERAAGLALEHAAQFRHDAELLDRIMGHPSSAERTR